MTLPWRRITLVCVLLILFVYAGDYLLVRLRMGFPKLGSAFDTVQFQRLLAFPLNSGRVEYEFDAQQPVAAVTCVRALFPHMSYQPCWYLRRQSEKPIPMVIFPAVHSVDRQ